MVTLLYFAGARERAGVSSERLDWSAGTTVQSLLDAVRQRHPSLADVLPRCRVAVDQSFVGADASVPDGAEIALIPPVAGG